MGRHTIGIDVGTSLAKCAVQDLEIVAPGEYVRQKRGPGFTLPDHKPDAVVIEWIDEAAGTYTPERSRVADMLRVHSTGTSIRDELLRAGVTVCCVPRNVILQQAGWCKRQKADEFVMRYLATLGFITTADRYRKGKIKPYTVSLTKGLTQTHDRDALMAALFNWSDPRNKQYLVTSAILRCQ